MAPYTSNTKPSVSHTLPPVPAGGVQVDCSQHLRRLGPLLLQLKHFRQPLADHAHLLLEGQHAGLHLREGVLRHRLVSFGLELVQVGREKVEELTGGDERDLVCHHCVKRKKK